MLTAPFPLPSLPSFSLSLSPFTPPASAPFIEKRGFLYKEGGHRKTWKMRYFVLQPGSFTYYKTNPVSLPYMSCLSPVLGR